MKFEEDRYWELRELCAEKAFRFLYDHFHRILLGYCIKNGHLKDDAAEIVQEVFCRFWMNGDSVGKNQKIQAYLFAIAKNVIVDRYRKLIKDKAAKDYQYHFLTATNDTEEMVYFNDLKQEIERTFNTLPEVRKLVFQMSRFKGYSNAEIAGELGISVKTVEGHISKALKAFRQELGQSAETLILIFWLAGFGY
ncbi:MAG: RNA polymerase sigma-70 factor [Bacteroidota bacterium]